MKNRRRAEAGKGASKRRLRENWPSGQNFRSYGKGLISKIKYTGSPYHKKIPGDFGLLPPATPRQDATLCDNARVFSRKKATQLLKRGASYGLVDEREDKGLPRIIWSVGDDGTVFEARLENADLGHYHGYPLPGSDSFWSVVADAYKKRSS